MIYKGLEVCRSDSRGGKAGRGKNKTATVQVREPIRNGWIIKKQFRFEVGNTESYVAAEQKAWQYVDNLKGEIPI